MTLTEFMSERYKNRKDSDNIFCVGVSDAEFRVFIIDYLLGKDWYVVDPLGPTQVNEIALYKILEKYSKRYKKERRRMNTPNFIQHLLCKIGEHNYNFDIYPMESKEILIDGQQAWLHTYRCACCGKVRRDITFNCGGEITDCHESILKDIQEV